MEARVMDLDEAESSENSTWTGNKARKVVNACKVVNQTEHIRVGVSNEIWLHDCIGTYDIHAKNACTVSHRFLGVRASCPPETG
jgi:hypothetical protein